MNLAGHQTKLIVLAFAAPAVIYVLADGFLGGPVAAALGGTFCAMILWLVWDEKCRALREAEAPDAKIRHAEVTQRLFLIIPFGLYLFVETLTTEAS